MHFKLFMYILIPKFVKLKPKFKPKLCRKTNANIHSQKATYLAGSRKLPLNNHFVKFS